MSLVEPTAVEKFLKLPMRTRIALLIAGLIALGLLLWIVAWAYSDNGVAGKREANTLVNIGIGFGENAVQANLVANQERQVNNALENANKANAALADSLKRDSNKFANSSDAATDAFCSRFVCDSTCASWRRRRGIGGEFCSGLPK